MSKKNLRKSHRLANLRDAGHFDNGGLLLPLCESGGLFMIRVDAGEGFAVTVKHFGFPMMVFPPSVFE
jgi:hypothetical protein